jgi:predicted helicase
MRWNLMKNFDKIYIIDLHGNSKKKETCPDGGKDENVFDIQQGVSINIFVKTKRKAKNTLAEVYHFDFFGKREEKYVRLLASNLSKIPFEKLEPSAPEYFFVPKDYGVKEEYEKGFSVQELFPVNSIGIVTARDDFTIHETALAVKNTIREFIKLDVETARQKFDLGKDTRDWSVAGAKKDLTSNPDFNKIVEINYRPFDKRFTYYTGNSKGVHCMPRKNVMQHFLKGENVGLITARSNKSDICDHFYITTNICEAKCGERTTQSNVFPLYLYHEDDLINGGRTHDKKVPNLNESIINKISQLLGLRFTAEKEKSSKAFAPIDLLDYIYAILHSPTYREKYKEFLKIDFPRVPYPKDAKQFRNLAKQGEKLRRLHLLEGINLKDGWARFNIPGSNEVDRPHYSDGKVYINNTQYFNNIPQEAWDFYIGGYQPAQKWLKDRKGRVLDFDDVQHYRRVVWVLRETGRVMEEIDSRTA